MPSAFRKMLGTRPPTNWKIIDLGDPPRRVRKLRAWEVKQTPREGRLMRGTYLPDEGRLWALARALIY
jgi:hypothetical protein